MKKASTLMLILSVTFSMLGTLPVLAHFTEVKCYADVTELGDLAGSDIVGHTFSLAVVVEDVRGLYGFDVQLNWSTEWITCTGHTVTVPIEDYPALQPPSPHGGILRGPVLKLKEAVDETSSISGSKVGTMGWFAWSAIAGSLPEGFNGSGTIVVMDFLVHNQPWDYEGDSTVHVHFILTSLSDPTPGPIPHTAIDWEIVIHSRARGGTVFIRADGSIYGTTHILTDDNVTYKLTASIGSSIVVERSNIVFDGQGYAVRGLGTGIGFKLQNIDNVTVRNTAIRGFSDGIRLGSSSGNTVSGNNIANNSVGVTLDSSSSNRVHRNIIVNNGAGILLHPSRSNNIITENALSNNGYGIYRWTGNTQDDLISHNNFVNNTLQVNNDPSLGNTWDNGCEGNYWSDYSGADSDNDGIGDTPYAIDENNTDRFPLASPYWNPGDVDHDLDVDIHDAVRLLLAFSSELGDKHWNCHVDIAEPHEIIDLLDAVLLLISYGHEYEP